MVLAALPYSIKLILIKRWQRFGTDWSLPLSVIFFENFVPKMPFKHGPYTKLEDESSQNRIRQFASSPSQMPLIVASGMLPLILFPLERLGLEIAALIASQSVKLYVSLKILQSRLFFISKLSNFYTTLSTSDVITRAHFPRAETTFASNLKTPRSTLF